MKTKLITTIILALFLAGMLMATAAAQPKKPLRCEVSIDLVWATPLYWEGTITGDIVGTITIYENPPSFRGHTEHFSETWVIATDSGNICGFDEGVWTFSNLKWVANGWVTTATGSWAYLANCKFQYSGTTTPVVIGESVHGTGTMMIVPGSH